MFFVVECDKCFCSDGDGRQNGEVRMCWSEKLRCVEGGREKNTGKTALCIRELGGTMPPPPLNYY